MTYSYKKSYYPAIKGSEVLIQVTTWMDLENIMLNERS